MKGVWFRIVELIVLDNTISAKISTCDLAVGFHTEDKQVLQNSGFYHVCDVRKSLLYNSRYILRNRESDGEYSSLYCTYHGVVENIHDSYCEDFLANPDISLMFNGIFVDEWSPNE